MSRKTTLSDIASVMEVIADAQLRLRNAGVDQWQDGYPTADIIALDIARGESFVYISDNQVGATAVISFAGEPTYAEIDGAWVDDHPYVVIHRLAVRAGFERQGLALKMFKFAHNAAIERGVTSARVDTHRDNIAMQNLLEQQGYLLCGEIVLLSGAKRIAYQKQL